MAEQPRATTASSSAPCPSGCWGRPAWGGAASASWNGTWGHINTASLPRRSDSDAQSRLPWQRARLAGPSATSRSHSFPDSNQGGSRCPGKGPRCCLDLQSGRPLLGPRRAKGSLLRPGRSVSRSASGRAWGPGSGQPVRPGGREEPRPAQAQRRHVWCRVGTSGPPARPAGFPDPSPEPAQVDLSRADRGSAFPFTGTLMGARVPNPPQVAQDWATFLSGTAHLSEEIPEETLTCGVPQGHSPGHRKGQTPL